MTLVERGLLWIDDRLGTAHFVRHALRKAFPDHWSFMLGEINLYAFIVLVANRHVSRLLLRPESLEGRSTTARTVCSTAR